MVDVLTEAQHQLNMSHIRGRDTKPEMLIRWGACAGLSLPVFRGGQISCFHSIRLSFWCRAVSGMGMTTQCFVCPPHTMSPERRKGRRATEAIHRNMCCLYSRRSDRHANLGNRFAKNRRSLVAVCKKLPKHRIKPVALAPIHLGCSNPTCDSCRFF